MAKRAYLYSASSNFKTLRDITEYKSEVPLLFKILLSWNTQVIPSQLWTDYAHPIAIQGGMQKGIERLYGLYDYLGTQAGFNQGKLNQYKKELEDFFIKQPDHLLDVFFLEPGEIFDGYSDDISIEELNEELCNEILSLSRSLSEILKNPEKKLSNFSNAHWLSIAQDDNSLLSLYWKGANYYSLNEYG